RRDGRGRGARDLGLDERHEPIAQVLREDGEDRDAPKGIELRQDAPARGGRAIERARETSACYCDTLQSDTAPAYQSLFGSHASVLCQRMSTFFTIASTLYLHFS